MTRAFRSTLRFVFLMAAVAVGLSQSEDDPFFELSSSRTFGVNGKPSVSLNAWNVDSLAFRVYRINDPVKFFEQLEDPHQFGGNGRRPQRDLTLLERLHDWKRGLHAQIRRSLRAQFSEPPSQHFTTVLPKELPAGAKGTHYAEAPVLNAQQLVLSFRQPVVSQSRWERATVEIGVKDKGVYLVEAVARDLRANTILIVSDLAMVTKNRQGARGEHGGRTGIRRSRSRRPKSLCWRAIATWAKRPPAAMASPRCPSRMRIRTISAWWRIWAAISR